MFSVALFLYLWFIILHLMLLGGLWEVPWVVWPDLCMCPWLQDTRPGGISKAELRTLWPQTCPLCTPGGWLECYSTGLFSKCSFQRKPKLTMERGTVGFPPMRKQDAADHARRASRTAQQLKLSLCCQYIPEFHHLHKCKGCWSNLYNALYFY